MREHTRLVDYFPVLMAVPPIAAFLCFALFRMSEKAAFGLTFIPMAIIITAVLLVVVHVAIVIYWLHRTGDPTGASGLFISVGGLLFHLVELGTTQAWAIDMKGLAAGPWRYWRRCACAGEICLPDRYASGRDVGFIPP